MIKKYAVIILLGCSVFACGCATTDSSGNNYAVAQKTEKSEFNIFKFVAAMDNWVKRNLW